MPHGGREGKGSGSDALFHRHSADDDRVTSLILSSSAI
jgi:hypothetical protein